MKITGIEIGEYRQFKNIKFDFTYPKDHPKAGQPLEKICFIGQSGTGKTTLLNSINSFLSVIAQSIKRINGDIPYESLAFYSYIPSGTVYEVLINENSYTTRKYKGLGRYDQEFIESSIIELLGDDTLNTLSKIERICIYIKDIIAIEADAFLIDQRIDSKNITDFIKTSSQIESERIEKQERSLKFEKQQVLSLGENKSLSLWEYILRDIIEYDVNSIELTFDMLNSNVSDADKLTILSKWKATNKNPKVSLAEKCLNFILKKLYLEVDLNKPYVPIALQTTKGKKLNGFELSTGTRQLLATAIPLYKLTTKETVILFDEPERSLFPDIQRDLVKYYISLAPEAQFFFATHSPIIAASFEPCERFILYFNEHGEVQVRNGIAPIGDDPNDLLHKDFGMSPLMQQEGLDAYKRYNDLATEVKNESDINRKMELLGERAELGNRYNFPAFNETN